VGQCLNLIGEIEHKAGRSALAKQYFEDSLDTFVRCVGSSSKEVVSPMYNLAMEMHRTKKYDDARILYEKVLEIDRKGKRGSHDIEYLTNIASVHDGLGIMLSEQKKYESAMSHLEDACKIYRKIYGDKNRDVAMSLKNMAFAWLKMGNQQVAITLYEEAIEILKNLNSRSDEEVLASTLNSLGELRVESKEYEKARALFMECLHIRVNLFGENHVDTVATLKNIGSVSYACENFEEAREFCLNALKLQKVLYGSESEEIAASCGQLAEICRCLGRGNEAKNLFKEAVRIYKSVYVNDHPTIALHLNNWASMLFSLGQYDECESIYNESLKMLISLNGGSKETTTIAASLHNLAELQRKLNKNAKALSLHEQSLAIRLKLLGPSHIEVASSLARISELMFLQNDKNAALESCGASLGIRMKAYGLEHEHVIESLQMMAKLKVAQGNLSDAEKFLRDALAAKENMDRKAYFTKVRLNGNNNEQKEKSSLEVTIVASLETATIIDFLCSVIPDDKEHLNEKIELYEKCLRIKRSLLGEEDNEVANTLTALANLSCLKGNFQDAIEINKIAKSIRANINGENHPLTCVSISNIANCLKRLGKLDEACDLFEQCVLNARVFNRSNDHPSVGIAIDNVASVLQLLEQYEQAAIFNEQALNIHTNAYGEANALVAATHYRIGHIHRMQSNYSKAKLHYMKALNVQRSVLGFNNEAVAASMEALAVSLELSGSTEEAKIIQNESSEVHIKVYRNGSEDRVQERLDLGTNLRSRAKYLESTHQFERALKIAIAMHGENHIDVVRALEGLAWLKDAKGVSTQARKYHQRALSIRAIISNDNKEDDRSDMRMMSNLALLLSEKTE
jgi:tetratricopeptide (TPR) repeat protein